MKLPADDPSAALDFWVGDWELESRSRVAPDRDEWVDGTASNRVRKVLDGKAILEEFDGRPAEDFRGMSLSILDASDGTWKQTWVDSTGGYMDFRGRSEPGCFVFERDTVRDGAPARMRMVFHDIAADSLVWDWEMSRDGGETFLLLWRLTYRRRAPAP